MIAMTENQEMQSPGHQKLQTYNQESMNNSSNVSFEADMQSCAVESKRGANVRSFIAI